MTISEPPSGQRRRTRARVGYISASDPNELSYDFGSMLPPELELVSAAPAEPIRQVTIDALEAAERGLAEAAGTLTAQDVEAIIVSIAPLIYVGGHGYDRLMIERLESQTGLPATTSQTAAVDALRALGVRRIALLNPNTSDLLAHQVRFFEESGVAVEVAKSLDIADNRDIDQVPRDVSHEFVRSAITSEGRPDGIYLSGPCWRTLDLIEPLEQEFDMAVVTALQAMVWAAGRLVDRSVVVEDYGRLLTDR